MRKIISLCLICSIMLFTSACSITYKHPETGIWYCDELKMSIDFTLYTSSDHMCVKVYNDDGTYEVMECSIDYGNGIWIDRVIGKEIVDGMPVNIPEQYFGGNFKWYQTKGELKVKSNVDGKIYTFIEVDWLTA